MNRPSTVPTLSPARRALRQLVVAAVLVISVAAVYGAGFTLEQLAGVAA